MLNPPFMPKYSRSSRSPAVTKGGTIYFPLWLAYATGVLEEAGHEVKLVDAPAEPLNEEQVLKIAKEFSPKLVVLDTSTASIHNDVKMLEKIKKTIDCFGVLVGPHVSALPIETMKMSSAIDAVCIQEYDYTLRELASELSKKKTNLLKIKGIIFRIKKKIISNKLREKIRNLDELPFVSSVYKKHLDYKKYFYSANRWPEITIVTGRGCPFRCKFCNWTQNLNPGPYRKRSIQNVIEELEHIKENFREVKEIFLEDDTFTADPERVEEFCRAKIAAKISIPWSCNARADVKKETLKLMKKAGCRLLCVGFESGSQQVLNEIRKGTTPNGMMEFMGNARKAGILVHGCFMIGNPLDNAKTIAATIELAKKLNPDTAQFFPIMVYPGTATYDYFRQKGYLTTEDFSKWVDEKGWHNCIVSMPGLSNREMVAWCDAARKKFYLRPEYVASKFFQVIKNPAEFPRVLKASRVFFKYLAKR
jgi:radical SAM superfamily enzyme YgiQ (UPF0313 family)